MFRKYCFLPLLMMAMVVGWTERGATIVPDDKPTPSGVCGVVDVELGTARRFVSVNSCFDDQIAVEEDEGCRCEPTAAFAPIVAAVKL